MDNIETLQSRQFSGLRFMEFSQDSFRKISLLYLAWLAVGLLMVLGAYFPWRSSPLSSIRPAILVYYIIASVHVIFRFKAGGRANVLAPDILFLFFYTMFHLGYVTLFSLGLIEYSNFVFFYESVIPQSLLVVNLGLVGFLFGYELLGAKGGEPIVQQPVKIPTRYWGIFGIAVMIIALAMHLIPLSMMDPNLLLRYGYAAIQDARRYIPHTVAMFLSQSSRVMLFGLVIYLVSSALRYGKLFRSKLALGLVITFAAILIMEGERGWILKLGIPILLVRHYFIKRIRIRYLAVFFVATLILFAGMAVVRTIVFQPAKMLQEYKYQKGAGVIDWRSPFLEMGGSFNVTTRTCHDVPLVEPYWKGKSYLSAALHTIPFLEGFFYRMGLMVSYEYQPAMWVTYKYHGVEGSGLGFTLPTEGYLNFGYPGAFFELMLFGLFIRWITKKFCRKPSAAWAFIMFGFLAAIIGVIRSQIGVITGLCFQILIVAGLLSWFLRSEPALGTEYSEAFEEQDGAFYEEYDNLQQNEEKAYDSV